MKVVYEYMNKGLIGLTVKNDRHLLQIGFH